MSLAHYLLQVNLYLIAFYFLYQLLLDRETYFKLNRFYLLGSGVLSLLIPLIRLEWLTQQKASQQVYASVRWEAILEKTTLLTEQSTFQWGTILVYLYAAGVLFFLFRLVFNLLMVKRLIHTQKSGSAFSFLWKKVIDIHLPKSDVIDMHEEAHIKQWHTLDILFFEILGALAWINPAIYLYKRSIRHVHEFLADEWAANYQGDKRQYALLILSQSFGLAPHHLTSGFFKQSLIKKRIFMLQKERSKKSAVLKYGISIPLLTLLIILSSATVRKNKELFHIAEQIPLNQPLDAVKLMISEPITKGAPSDDKVDTEIPQNWKNFYDFVSRKIQFPAVAYHDKTQGQSQVVFAIQNRRLVQVKALGGLNGNFDEEAVKSVRAYPDFNKLEDGRYQLTINFKIPGSTSTLHDQVTKPLSNTTQLQSLNIIAPTNDSNAAIALPISKPDQEVYDFVSIEKQPEYPGGLKKLYEYLSKSIRYPEEALVNQVEGKVFLSFVVETDGTLSDIQITRGLGSGTDEEAVRVFRECPKWNPGLLHGQAVKVKYNINVNFKMNDQEKVAKNNT